MAKRLTLDKLERRANETPDMSQLKSDWLRCVDRQYSNYWHRQRLNWEARYGIWTGQTTDGKKWPQTGSKKRVFPWAGASDARVLLVDKLIQEDVAMLMTAWSDMRVLARPTAPSRDADWATRATALMRWLVYEEMQESEAEAELLANLMLERGAAALGIWWRKEESKIRETIELRQLEEAAAIARERLLQGEGGDALQFQALLPELVKDPTLEPQAVEMVKGLMGRRGEDGDERRGEDTAPYLSEARIKKALRDLRETGVAHYPRPIVSVNRPCIRALAWNEDIWTPPETTDLQKSRQVFTREWLSQAEVEERAKAYGWDEGYVDRMLDTQRGRVTELNNAPRLQGGSWNLLGVPDTDHQYEIVTGYERLLDGDGIPGIYATVFNPGMPTELGNAGSELVDYAHCQYPFVVFQTEMRSRLADDARGYGERASTLQSMIKQQWDMRTDRASVSTLPPSHHPPGEEPDAWGPGVQIPTLQPERFGYFEIPKLDAGSKEMELTVREFVDEYFGRVVREGANRIEAAQLKREMVRKWLRGWKAGFTQVFQLTQQYLPDEVYFRVVGDAQGRTMRATREEIQGPFNVSLRFNTGDLDSELVEQKLGLIEKVLALDANGIIDRNEVIKVVFELLDPGYAERLVQPAEQAAMKEIKDEQDTLAKLLLGIQVDVMGNEAFGLRKQVLTTMIQNNPIAQQIIQSQPTVQENVQRRIEQLDFNIQQRLVNPEIGRRLGTQPSTQLPGPGQMAG